MMRITKTKLVNLVPLVVSLLASTDCFPKEYSVGVYYYPGWQDFAEAGRDYPWEKIKPFPEREPTLGWYKEGEVDIANKHLAWMHDYGIDFVAYDWYWDGQKGAKLTQAIDAYLKSENQGKVKFTLLWANHSRVPESLEQFDRIVDFWIRNYFHVNSYLTKNDMPVVIVFSPGLLDANAKKFGQTGELLLKYARDKAIKAGMKGIYFVGATHAIGDQVEKVLPAQKYNAVTAYNYHYGLSGKLEHRQPSHDYQELAAGYYETWSWIVEHTNMPYFIPVTSGWDVRPWGGSKDAAHDNSVSDPVAFKNHLLSARKIADQYPGKTDKTIMICCWNEFGEGSYIEPTKKYGMQYLEAVQAVFGVNP